MKNTLIGIVVAVVVIIVAVVAFGGKKDTATPSASISASSEPTTLSSASPLIPAPISYTESGYSPANIIIKKGDSIIFTNNSKGDMWPASGIHPTHKVYTEQDSCFAGVFTNCSVAPGGTYSMKFNIVGTWQYHDHRTPSKTGSIIVTH